jgi:hypothetical protein
MPASVPNFALSGLIKEKQGMLRITKLIVIGVLTGTLGVVGCGDDDTSGGGSGGAGGAGGAGGQEPPPPVCGAGESIDESFTTGEGLADCNGLDVISVPISVVLAAKADVIDGETDVDVQVQFIISEETVGDLGALVQEALIGEASADVDDDQGGGVVNVPATVPCSVDFTDDPDDNGAAGPIVVTTPVKTAAWTAIDGSIVVEAVEMTFGIVQPVALPLSTAGDNPACTWDTVPTVTLEAPAP